MSGWRVRPSVEADWRAYRELRLEMLADSPIAFTETVDRALLHPDEHWRGRARNGTPHSRLFAGVAEDGRWLGTMGGFHPSGTPYPHLVGVYVTPGFRGASVGLTDALLDAVIEWSRFRSDRLLLSVHEHNQRATRYYLRRGFELTGACSPYPLDPASQQLEMALTVG